MFNSILVICTGNICRSPLGERLLRQCISDMKIDSAGTHGLVGCPADTRAEKIALSHGLSLNGHVSRKIDLEMVGRYDLILAMGPKHINHVTTLAPEARGKTLLFGQWIGEQEIPDPFARNLQTFEHVYHLLSQASQEWAKRLGK
ncbi:arsenate reductase/protein-tyrosine-phosphatase family protein [Enterobacter mori]|uniref:arsenate reductase/protein-tyrosine-phosphatase family protein n=1 Tax=Enterobacter mori TaxID=539813 RepID=UPI002B1ED489|nr:protein tyrosine phosphatase [Enterobacter mori]MEA5206378.1 protein tyrosine phosphatase [Enterobacter mori]